MWVEARDGVRRWNPGSKRTENPLKLKCIHHVEFWVGNARQAAYFYRKGFGFSQVAYSGLETGQRQRASYALSQGKANFILTTPMTPDDLAVRGGSARFRDLTSLHSPAVNQLTVCYSPRPARIRNSTATSASTSSQVL